MKNNRFGLKEVILIIVTTSILVSFTTVLIIGKRVNRNDSLLKDKNITIFVEAYNTLKEKYYLKFDEDKFMEKVIKYMYESLEDPYTTYLSKEETENLKQSLQGNYEGIGVRIVTSGDDKIIYEIFKNSPAEEAGLAIGDIFQSVNNQNVKKMKSEDLVNLIKNSSSNNINISVKRKNETKSFILKLADITIPSIYSEVKILENKKIGYIRIETFAVNTASQFRENIETLESKNIESLIIDVRTNTGGYLTSVSEILEMMLAKDKVMYSIESKTSIETTLDTTEEKREYKVSVLINELSASASEVLAGAMKDSYGATIVGKTSFGKGKVQQTSALDDGSSLKYTIANWKRPNGECIDQKGIKPDYEAEYNIEMDYQLETALQQIVK